MALLFNKWIFCDFLFVNRNEICFNVIKLLVLRGLNRKNVVWIWIIVVYGYFRKSRFGRVCLVRIKKLIMGVVNVRFLILSWSVGWDRK